MGSREDHSWLHGLTRTKIQASWFLSSAHTTQLYSLMKMGESFSLSSLQTTRPFSGKSQSYLHIWKEILLIKIFKDHCSR